MLTKRSKWQNKHNDKTHLRKEWQRQGSQLLFPGTVLLFLTLYSNSEPPIEKSNINTHYTHTHRDTEHTPLSKPDETEKQDSEWKVCPWAETHWPCNIKGWVNGCRWLWLAVTEQGEGCCAGWGLQTGGQSGGVVKSFHWEYGLFGYDCCCWHVISLAVVTQGGGLGPKSTILHCGKTGIRFLSPRVETKDYVRD